MNAKRRRRLFVPVALAAGLLAVLGSCKRGPDDATLLAYSKAAAAYDAGRLVEAESLAADLRSFYPAMVLLGKARWFSGNTAEAENAFRSALRLRPSSTEARLALSRVLRAAQKTDEAAALIEDVLADDPEDSRALRLAAELALDGGDARAASAFLDRAADAAAETGLMFLDRARLRWTMGDGQGARQDIQAALAVLPPDSAASRAAQSLKSALDEARP